MSLQQPAESVDISSFETHLSKALDHAESDSTKYHLREAYQKIVILEEDTQRD